VSPGNNMPKIKIFETNTHDSYECYDTVISNSTLWDVVTEEELAALWLWVDKQNKTSRSGRAIIIFQERGTPHIKECVNDYLLEMKATRAREEKKRQTRLAAKKARENKKYEKELQQQKEEYEKLKAKFEK